MKLETGKNQEMEIWVGTAYAAKLIGINKRNFVRAVSSGKYTVKMEDGNGGKQYRILLSSLPTEAQIRYFEEHLKTGKADSDQDVIDLDSEAEEYNRRKADKYRTILRACSGLFGNDLKSFIAEWNTNYPNFKTDYTRVLSKRKELARFGEMAYFSKYGNRSGDTKVPDDLFEYFKSMFLTEQRRTYQDCYQVVKGIALQKGIEIPSVHAFQRRLERTTPQSVIDLKRHGWDYYNKKWNNFVDRDYKNVKAGQIWVSDHRQLDTAITLPNGKVVFPWVTAWRDFKTGKWLGWCFHAEDPNSEHILQAFFNAATVYGIPEGIIIDNGKDYKCKTFAGGKPRKIKVMIDEKRVRSLTGMLNIEARFAQAYNAQTKPIERDFRIMKEWLDRKFDTYRGGHTQERPEGVMDAIKSGRAVELKAFETMFDFFINEILHKAISDGKVLQGRTRDEAWAEELAQQNSMRKVTPFEMKLFCMRASGDLTIRRNGVTLSQKDNIYYYATWMEGLKGRKVYLRRDPKHYEEAWVFSSEDGRFLGTARLNAFRAAAWAQDGVEKEELAKVLKQKRTAEKIAKILGETNVSIPPDEQLELAAFAYQEGNRKKLPTPKESNVYVMTKMSEAARREQLRTGTDDIDAVPLNVKKKDDEPEGWV